MLGFTNIPEMFSEKEAYDQMLYVAPAWRRDGVGQKLLAAYAKWAEDQGAGGRIFFGTTTRLTQVGAIRMAEKEGFKPIGQITRRY